jgi:lipopolysaccharide/colanic/teichoic acid biosynthesis glycosyltransferase
MHPDLLRLSKSLDFRELLFVGFEKTFDANVRNFPYESEQYEYTLLQDSITALEWLEQKVENITTFQPPYAVICKLDWLQATDFELVHAIEKHPDLRHIPIIALADTGSEINKILLAQKGVDDCYIMPVDWPMLEKRLEFLNQYKPYLLESQYFTPLKQPPYRIPPVKRIMDVIGASIAILLTAPISILVAIAIKLESRGPVFYRSKRVGTGYKTFDFIKFRSMSVQADRLLDEYRFRNQYADGTVFIKIANDPRVTRVGRFIRKYSIDELPQLINVLRGEMSIVGNRPLPLYEAETLTRDEWCARFMAPAGITGLWQVTKRGKSDMSQEERIALDIAYARNFSLLNDLKIMLKTPLALVQKENV